MASSNTHKETDLPLVCARRGGGQWGKVDKGVGGKAVRDALRNGLGLNSSRKVHPDVGVPETKRNPETV